MGRECNRCRRSFRLDPRTRSSPVFPLRRGLAWRPARPRARRDGSLSPRTEAGSRHPEYRRKGGDVQPALQDVSTAQPLILLTKQTISRACREKNSGRRSLLLADSPWDSRCKMTTADRSLRPGNDISLHSRPDSPPPKSTTATMALGHPTLNAEQRRLRAANGRWKMLSRRKSRLVT
jgi:hypothetical protein